MKTDEVERMKEPYGEGVATRSGPESCAVAREGEGEALTGERVGWVLSREDLTQLRGADAVRVSGRPHRAHRYREMLPDPARSETPCTHGTTSNGNREIPRPAAEVGAAVRAVNPKGGRRR